MSDLNAIEIDVVLQRPITVNITVEDGTVEKYQLPRLGVDGLIPWLDEITAQRRDSLRKAIESMKLDPRQKLDAEFTIEQNTRAVISDLNIPALTPQGTRRILAMSLSMTGLPADKQQSILAALMGNAGTANNLAGRLSTLFATTEQRPPAPTDQEKAAAAAKEAFPGIKPINVGAENPTGAGAGPNTPDPVSTTTG